MPIRRCLVTIGITAAVIEISLSVLDFATGAGSRMGTYLATCAAVTLGMTAALYWLLGLPPRDDDDGGSRIDDNPPPPPWWPDFERDFREYDRRRAPRPTVRG